MISIVLATLGNRIDEIKRLLDSLEKQTNNDFEVIIVSQDNHDLVENIIKGYKINYKHKKLNKKGLSLARNEGLNYVSGDIITFSDDDCWYPYDSFERIKNIFEKSKSSVCCFNIYDPLSNQYYKNYKKNNKYSLNDIDIMRISSIEIFINTNKVKLNHIKFDERFGLGSRFNSGEENIMLVDLIKNKYSIDYHSEIIVYHEKKQKNNNLDSKVMYSKGAMFKRMYPNLKGILYANLLAIKNIRSLNEKLSCLYSINKGFKEFEKFDMKN